MRIIKENSIAVIIDVQDRLFPHIYENIALERNLGIFVKGLKILDIPIIVTEQYSKGLGYTIPSIKSILPEYQAIEKTCFSCCDEQVFRKSLLDSGKKYVIIAGIESHVCVMQTVNDLIEIGLQPVVIEDCVSSRNLNDKKISIKRMQQEGAIISTYESILFELCRISGTDKFKEISKLVK